MSALRGVPTSHPGGSAADEPCCAVPESPGNRSICPASRHAGQPVAWRTVAALALGPLPPKQDFWLCRDPQCEVVYFGAAGARMTLPQLRVRPGFKCGGELLCYCFLVRHEELETEITTTGATTIPDRIAARVQAGGCACEVRNPSGKCCLAEVRALARDLSRQ